MKKTLSLGLSLIFGSMAFAQIETPAPSPMSEVEQMVGLTEIEIAYSRPSMKGREIFGSLVPFDKIWRTGANSSTKITFGDDVTFGETEVEAGTYALYTKPGKESWEVYLYKDYSLWGAPRQWDESMVVASYTATPENAPMNIETFTITLDNLSNNGAQLGISWENTYVGVPIVVPTAEKAKKSIESVLSGPNGDQFYAAAAYYFQEGMNLNQAQEWIEKAVSMEPNKFWISRMQSLIYAKQGNNKKAISAAKNSLKLAEAAGNEDYIRMNTESLKEWGVEME